MEGNIIVSINCIVYNQARYLRQCLDGFIMQKVDFKFVAIVHDDASTDGSADIIREYAEKYPNIIRPIIEKENQYSKHDGSLDRIMSGACIGKYIAFCEGDDYWIDPFKLQKEVDYMEGHKDCSIVYTKNVCKIERENSFIDGHISRTNFIDLLEGFNTIPTASTMVRYDAYQKYLKAIKPFDKGWIIGDYPKNLYLTRVSEIGFIDDITCVYRVLPNSASHATSEKNIYPYYRNILEIKLFFYNFFEINNRKVLNRIYLSMLNLWCDVYFRSRDEEALFEIKKLTKFYKPKNIKSFIKFKFITNNKKFLRLSVLIMNKFKKKSSTYAYN